MAAGRRSIIKRVTETRGMQFYVLLKCTMLK